MIECVKMNPPSRKEQLQTWEISDTNKEIILQRPADRVKFSKEVQLFAACSHSEIEEIKKLLSEGVDINVVNIDGLSVLHQACIENDYDLATFLIENGSNVNAQDHEGWTPLHVCASGAYTELAKLLLDNGASAGIVSFEMELPIDVAQGSSMQTLLQEAMQKQGVDAPNARKAEEKLMLEHANTWLKTGNYPSVIDSRTGATALHVAAAKNYCGVIEVLLKIPNIDIDATDNDGWTPLHAAAHWAKEQPLRLLASAGANFDKITLTNQSIFDVADRSVTMLMRQLRESQRIERYRAPEKHVPPIISPTASRRRSEGTLDEVSSKKQHKDDSEEILEKENMIPVDFNNTETDKSVSVVSPPIQSLETTLPVPETKSIEIPSESKTPSAELIRDSGVTDEIRHNEVRDSPIESRIPDTIAPSPSVTPAATAQSAPCYESTVLEKTEGEHERPNSLTVDKKILTGHVLAVTGALTVNNDKTQHSPSRVAEQSENISPIHLPNRRVSAVLAPVKSEETEVQRSSKARQVRSTRRSTQGIANDVLEEALRRNVNESNNRVTTSPPIIENNTAIFIPSRSNESPTQAGITFPAIQSEYHGKITSQKPGAVIPAESSIESSSNKSSPITGGFSISSNNNLPNVTCDSSSSAANQPVNSSRLRRVCRVPTGKINQSDVLAAARQLEESSKLEEQSPIPRPTSRFLRASGVMPDSSNGDRPTPSPIRQFSPLATRNGSISRTNMAMNSISNSPESGFSRDRINYQRLYEEERIEKDRLQCQLKNLNRDFELLKKEYSHLQSLKSLQQGDPSRLHELSPSSEIERLRQENAKLSDDNKSLVRVISKLSSRS